MSKKSEQELRTEALESLLIEKGLLDSATVDAVLTRYNERVGPMNGAQVVARAWLEPDFKAALLADGTAAVAPYEFEGGEMEKLVVVHNDAMTHNMIVCTLCSCYPWALLGLPPAWYKDPAYRSRIVAQPRAVLREFGLDLPEQQKVRVWDSSAEVRYMVLPQAPVELAGKSVQELAETVSRNAMIGVALH